MMPIILNIVKYSPKVRDMMIEMLREAMDARYVLFCVHLNLIICHHVKNQSIFLFSDPLTRQMGLHGFCAILKMLHNNNSQRSIHSTSTYNVNSSQFPLSGYSLMTQGSINTNISNTQRNFNIFALEIIGMLQKCFNQTHEIKEIMYKGLSNVILFNDKLTPHIIRFLDAHFRGYFDIDDMNFNIHFDMIIRENNNGFEIVDNLPILTKIMGQAIVTCKKKESLGYDTEFLTTFFQTMMKSVHTLSLEKFGLVSFAVSFY